MSADLILRVLAVVFCIFMLTTIIKDSPETHEEIVDKYITLTLFIVITICSIAGLLLKYIR